ncbi:MAG: GntR family transcriptional regulator, partial [Anaerolineales bacterium]|nr:GntR family transcriptional regulator [Anaerolineales bacterium]
MDTNIHLLMDKSHPTIYWLGSHWRGKLSMVSMHSHLGNKTTNLSDMVFNSIMAAILDGTFKRGQILTAEEVADWLGVSRTPVREAFMLLYERGLLEKNSSRSYVVARGNKTDILEVAQLRVALESLAIELAIKNVKPEDFDILESIIMQIEGAAKRGENTRLVDLDLQFHISLWKIAGNTRLQQILEIIKIQL